jgi:hypothetical protein
MLCYEADNGFVAEYLVYCVSELVLGKYLNSLWKIISKERFWGLPVNLLSSIINKKHKGCI